MFAGKPTDPENYDQHDLGDLQVYTPKFTSYDPDGVTIDLKGDGIYRRLVVEGISF